MREDTNSMPARSRGYCTNCNTNVLHVRCFNSRLTYFLDRISGHFLARFGLGPWQCVDCGSRNMRLIEPDETVKRVCDESDGVDAAEPVHNFIRTEQSLAHAVENTERFSQKFRFGIVEKLLTGKSIVSLTCNELNVSELVIQRWIMEYLEAQIQRVAESNRAALIPADLAGVNEEGPLNWNEGSGEVIEVDATRKPS